MRLLPRPPGSELPQDAEQPVQLRILAGVAAMPRRIRWAATVEVGDAVLDGGDDPEQGRAIELRDRRSGGVHDGPEHTRSAPGLARGSETSCRP